MRRRFPLRVSVGSVVMLATLGCQVGSLHEPPYTREGITREELLEAIPTADDVPQGATSIHVYAISAIDSCDLRILMSVPAGELTQEVERLRRLIGANGELADGADDLVSEIADDVHLGLTAPEWPEEQGVPEWWKSVSTRTFTVIGVQLLNGKRTMWLVDRKSNMIAMWQFQAKYLDEH